LREHFPNHFPLILLLSVSVSGTLVVEGISLLSVLLLGLVVVSRAPDVHWCLSLPLRHAAPGDRHQFETTLEALHSIGSRIPENQFHSVLFLCLLLQLPPSHHAAV
jgi:hypothetical protein